MRESTRTGELCQNAIMKSTRKTVCQMIHEASYHKGGRPDKCVSIGLLVSLNGEWQLSNGNCTTERNCGFHNWYAKTMCSSRGPKLGSTTTATKPHKFAHLTTKSSIFARFAPAFFIFWHFEDVLVLSMTWNDFFCSYVDDVNIWWRMFNFVLSQALVPI